MLHLVRTLLWCLTAALLAGTAADASVEEPARPLPKVTQVPPQAAAEEHSGSPEMTAGTAPEGAATAEPKQPPSGRRVLEGYGIDESYFAQLRDGRPLHVDEEEALRMILYQAGRLSAAEYQKLVLRSAEPPGLFAAPDEFRGEVFRIQGRLQRVTAEPLAEEIAERFEMGRYYRCEVLWGDGDLPAVVYSVRVPRSWPLDEPLDEPVAAYGFFVKLGGQPDDRPEPMFAAARMEWYPQKVSPQTGVNAGMAILAGLGMDVALLDRLVDNTSLRDREGTERLESQRKGPYRDREPFYQMLTAVERAQPGQLLREANRLLEASGEDHVSVVPLFNDPAQQRGRLVVLDGAARRVVKVLVSDKDIQQRFGIDHYYEVHVFTEDSQTFPLVFCVRHLPPDLPESTGPDYSEPVRVAGFFFKKWAYFSEQQEDTRAKQTAPLLIGREAVRLQRPESGSNVILGAIAAGVFLLAVVVVWIGIWRYNRADEQARDKTLAQRYSLASGESLAGLSEQDAVQPDFEHLRSAEAADRDGRGTSDPRDGRP